MTSLPSLPILAADALPTGLPTVRRDAPAGTLKGCYALVSLGCPKNLVDTERMLGRLHTDGYSLVSDPVGADFVVVNTCGFIDAARQESLAAIDEMLELKRRGDVGGVVVAGCLAERQREALFEARHGHITEQPGGLFDARDAARAGGGVEGAYWISLEVPATRSIVWTTSSMLTARPEPTLIVSPCAGADRASIVASTASSTKT